LSEAAAHVNAIAQPGAAGAFGREELARFRRDGFIVVRDLAEEALRERMLAVARSHLAAEIAPVEYEADTRYPGAPASLDAPGGRTVRRLLQA
jgi:phytanoyl-CoA hydroxylase